MDRIETYEIEGRKFYMGIELLNAFLFLRKICKSQVDLPSIVPDDSWIFAKKDKKTEAWAMNERSTLDSYNRAWDKIFVLREFFDDLFKDEMSEETKSEKPDLPSQIYLEKREMFRNDEGKCLHIETRGERKWDGIFFKLSDFSKALDLPDLSKTISNKGSSYEEGKDYRYFCLNNEKRTKKSYLTYQGVLRVFFTTRSNRVRKFVSWACETLFVSQMGTPEQKKRKASELLSVTYEVVKCFMNTAAYTLPAIYLFELGTVRQYREKMELSEEYLDDQVLYKFGRTENLLTRHRTHQRDFAKLRDKKQKAVKVSLVFHCYVDVKYVSTAEGRIKDFFGTKDYKKVGTSKNSQEIVIIDKEMMKKVEKEYGHIANEYQGRYTQVISDKIGVENQMKNLKKEMMLIIDKYETEIKSLKKQLKEKKREIETMKENHAKELESQKREYELKLQLKDAEGKK